MKVFYDLHLHSCLSPCGGDDMTPNNLVNMAVLLGYQLIAVTDHNACGNAKAAMEAGRAAGLVVVPGMELCTAEEAHVVCLFPTLKAAE
ncbi:MAG TPA: PHP domain-containing protein, partial [Candidatus Caccousia stercoris]|nr:PHP domain-containing protein [Candidatus Caccousia stercoris]